jgi:glycosyltransferase involved in cell wall biosynthesis
LEHLFRIGSLAHSARHDHYLDIVRAAELEPEIVAPAPTAEMLPAAPAVDLLRLARDRMRDSLNADAILAATAAFWRLRPRIVHVRQNWAVYTIAALLCGVERVIIHIGLVPERESSLASEQAICDFAPSRHTFRLLGQHPAVQFVLNSQAGVSEYAAWLDLPRHKFRLLHNGFSPQEFPPPAPCRIALWRQKLKLPDNAFVIGSVMRLSAQKHPLLWLAVCAEVARRVPEAYFLLIGDGLMREELDHRIRRSGLSGRVHIHGRAKEELADLYGLMDVFLLTSRREGLPNGVVEAQSYGIPVVASDVAGTAEAIIPGETGFVVALDERDDYVARILEIHRNQDMSSNCHERAAGFVQEKFSMARFTDDLWRLYSGE